MDQPAPLDYLTLNSQLNIIGDDGLIQFERDQDAVRAYFLESVNPNTVYFHDLEEKLRYLVANDYYEAAFLEAYRPEFVKSLFKAMYAKRFRFATFVGAYKFYTGYALKTFDGTRFLERYEDRIAIVALYLAEGSEKRARDLAEEMIAQRYQPATPTFLNAGKKQRGELVSCFLLELEDSMNSIGRTINSALQLSKRGGGVAFNLTNLRGANDPIKNVEGQSSGVIPVMKLLEDCFSYANQLGARQGAGAVYLHAHHIDVLTFLDCRREAADEKIRIKTLSLGIVIPDITFELAKGDEDMYLFSPYDVSKKLGMPFAEVNISEVYRELVDDPNIRKTKIKARRFFQMIAETQFESGYPYILFEDNANRANPIAGKIKMSNLCVTGETELLTASGPRRARELYESGEDLQVMVDRRTIAMDADERGVAEYSAIPMHLTARDAEVFKVETFEGFELRATEWHRMFVLRDGEVVKLPLAEVRIGDRLLVQSGEGTFGEHHDPDLAYIAGQLAGDGTFGHGRDPKTEVMRLDLYGDKEAFCAPLELAAAGVLERHYDRGVHHSTTLAPTFREARHGRRSLSSRPLTEVLADHGVRKATKTRVPDFVKQGDKETVVAYLSGLYQADGSVTGSTKTKVCSIELGSIHRDFLQDVQRLLINLGIFSRIYAARRAGTTLLPDGRGGMREYPTKQLFSLRMNDRVARETFMDLATLRSASERRYHEISSTFTSTQQASHRFTAKVVAITPDGIEDVYDTTVADVHSLIFNGVATGNCSEILQVSEPSEIDDQQQYQALGKDISCNLGSLNVANVMDGGNIPKTVEIAIRALTAVSDSCDISVAPTIQAGNARSHAVGLGAMNLHGYLGRERIRYDSPEAVDFVDAYFRTIAYNAIWASSKIARERGESFDGFERSAYASGDFFRRYDADWRPKTAAVRRLFRDHHLPSAEDWARLERHVRKHGMYNQNLQAIAPTGSISYVNHATASIHPITAKIESRKEGKMGRVYYPAAGMGNDNLEFFDDAYRIGWKALIDVYAAASQHIDQGLSLTLFFSDAASTRDINQAQIYAWSKGIKTLYYVRVQSEVLEGTDSSVCVSCSV